MQFECEILFGTAKMRDDQDLVVRVISPMSVEILLNDKRPFNVMRMRKQIVAGLNKELDNLVEQYLKAGAMREDAINKQNKQLKDEEEVAQNESDGDRS